MSDFLDVSKSLVEISVRLVELLGVLTIAGMSVYAIGFALVNLSRKQDTMEVFRKMRQRLGRGILLGLEFLIGADIIHTVAIDLSFHSVGVLAVVVLIRTFLSFTIELELNGKWPWQEKVSSDRSP